MGWLKNLFKSPTPAVRKPAKPPTTNAPTTTPKMVPCDFIDLTEGEAFLICEMVGGEYLTADSRMTITERLAETVGDEGGNTSGFMLDYWADHEVDAVALRERLIFLRSKQAQCIITAAKKFWKFYEEADYPNDCAHLLIEVGLVKPPI